MLPLSSLSAGSLSYMNFLEDRQSVPVLSSVDS